MIVTTKGIVLHSMDYAETCIIVRIYTEQLGLQSYLVRGVRKKGAKLKRNLFSPLSVLQIVVSHKETEGLRTLKEASVAYPLYNINKNITKTAISIFISETLVRTTTQHLTDKNLYNYIEKTILKLNEGNCNLGAFPLTFCMQLMRFLGCMPHNNFDATHTVFNLKEGVFCNSIPTNAPFANMPVSRSFALLLEQPIENMGNIEYSSRKALLDLVLNYFKEQIPNFGSIKSVGVLHEVLK